MGTMGKSDLPDEPFQEPCLILTGRQDTEERSRDRIKLTIL